MTYLKSIFLINTLLLIVFSSLRVSAQEICSNANNKPEIEALCRQLEQLKLERDLAKTRTEIAVAGKDQVIAELDEFKAKLPNTGITPLPGTITTGDNAFGFESNLLATAAMKKAVEKLRGKLGKEITTGKNKIYIYPAEANGEIDFYSSYQKYDYFNLQYNALVKEYDNQDIRLTPKEKINYFNALRGIETGTNTTDQGNEKIKSIPAAIGAVAGSIIQIGQLFNVNREVKSSKINLSNSILVSEIYQQFNNKDNAIYYPKLYSLEKKAMDTIIENMIELLYLQQQGRNELSNDKKDQKSKEKIENLNKQVTALLGNIFVAAADPDNQNNTTAIFSNNAESIISSLARGYSIFENVNKSKNSPSSQNNSQLNANSGQPENNANQHKQNSVYILYVNPIFGGNSIPSQSLFGNSTKVSGGLILDYKLYKIDDEIGSSGIYKAGYVYSYIAPKKINEDFVKLIEILGK